MGCSRIDLHFSAPIVYVTMCFCKRTISCLSSLSTHPLFSTLLTFFALVLLYFPRLFWRLLFSPVLLLTGALLLSLLRLGATQKFLRQNKVNPTVSQTETKQPTANDAVQPESLAAVPVPEEDHVRPQAVPQHETDAVSKAGNVSCPCFEDTFVQWNVRAPLEVIYEEYEGLDDGSNESDPYTETVSSPHVGIERYPSLSLYYPETDSNSSSDDEFPMPGAWDSLDNTCFMWDDEDREELLIEIALDKNKKTSEFQFEEDNLIEIDISPTRNDQFPDVK